MGVAVPSKTDWPILDWATDGFTSESGLGVLHNSEKAGSACREGLGSGADQHESSSHTWIGQCWPAASSPNEQSCIEKDLSARMQHTSFTVAGPDLEWAGMRSVAGVPSVSS